MAKGDLFCMHLSKKDECDFLLYGGKIYMLNKRKSIAAVLAVLLIMIMSVTLLAACAKEDLIPDINISVYLGEEVFDNTSSKQIKINDLKKDATVEDMLNANTALNAVLVDSEYGAYITSIGTLIPANSNQFISVFSTDASYKGDFAEPITHEGKTFYGSNVGISQMTVAANNSYAFMLTTYIPDEEVSAVKPIDADTNINELAEYLKVGIEPTLARSERINALIKAGVVFSDDNLDALSKLLDTEASKYTPTALNLERALPNLGYVIYTTSALLHVGKKIPDSVITYVNSGVWMGGFTEEWSTGVMLPLATELDKAGYPITVINSAIDTLLGAVKDGIFDVRYADSAGVAVIALLPYYDKENVKLIIDKTVLAIQAKTTNNVDGNISRTAYILALSVELNFYNVENNLDDKGMYDWLISKQNSDGSIGGRLEPVQSFRGLVSYQLNKSGQGTFYTSKAK